MLKKKKELSKYLSHSFPPVLSIEIWVSKRKEGWVFDFNFLHKQSVTGALVNTTFSKQVTRSQFVKASVYKQQQDWAVLSKYWSGFSDSGMKVSWLLEQQKAK